MCLNNISHENIVEEQKSIDDIFSCIRNSNSFIFNSGAGSGKTYALKESLIYTMSEFEKSLIENNQNIICITYTNVATNEVKDRLGTTDLVIISTIHVRLWSLIKKYQKELTEIHKENLSNQINELELVVSSNSDFKMYNDLSLESQQRLSEIMLEQKSVFYKHYNDKSAEFRDALNPYIGTFTDVMRNVAKFKRLVSTLYKINNFKNAVDKIENRISGYTKVEYNASYNRDQLHRMRISHDTLLDYGFEIISRYDLLKKIIIDKYPFIFVDEYQDTSEKVIRILSMLDQYSEKISHPCTIGYFGDSAQNIYSDGVGKRISSIHNDLVPIYKKFNRRSTSEIISVINKIRDDEIEQESIYKDSACGSIKFYSSNKDDALQFVYKYVNQWATSTDDKLHCLVLTNKTVAYYSGFPNIYSEFVSTERYRINYDQINTELLSHEIEKLGEIQALFYKIIELMQNLKDESTSIKKLVPSELYKNISIVELRSLLDILKLANGSTLAEYLKSLIEPYVNNESKLYQKCIDLLFDLTDVTYEKVHSYILNTLYTDLDDEKIDEANEKINSILSIEITEYVKWFDYINRNYSDKVIYHTYHGTKGLEFKNVVIIMENAFGKMRNYFNNFFTLRQKKNNLTEKETEQYENAKNLLYVSCSRAIRNLRVVYIDEIQEFENGIKEIFGEISPYTVNESSQKQHIT